MDDFDKNAKPKKKKKNKPVVVEYRSKNPWNDDEGWNVWKRYTSESVANTAIKQLNRKYNYINWEFRLKH